ncbi:MAG: ABC transporter ATP-binding protein [Betaproteobacteria bacterium]
MLSVQGLRVRHGAAQALRGISLSLAPGQVLAVLGRNGSGRSSLARALMGLVPATGRLEGQVLWRGQELLGLAPHQIARLGVGYVPQTRDVFPLLTVHQNLLLGLPRGLDAATERERLAWAYSLFVQLQARSKTLGARLSGGEQQMLSLARSLLARPQLLIVDEPTEGLAPQLVQTVGQVLREQAHAGVAIVLMEQKLDLVPALADQVLVLGRGEVVFDGTPQALQQAPQVQRLWLEG